MATVAARGTGTPATTGTTWATTTNAVDGAAGTNPATYTTLTSAVSAAVATIEVTGYGFSTTVGASDTLNSVTVSLRHFENNTGRFASVTFQAFDGATAIGTATTCTLATAARNDTATPAVTLAQLRSSTFKIRVTITGAASTQSRVESIDYVDVTADYTPLPPAITQAAYRFYADSAATPTLASGYDETNVQATIPFGNGTTNRLGQSFLGNGEPLVSAGWWLNKLGTPVGNVTATLYAHSGTFGTSSVGTGAALATSTAQVATSLSTSFAWVDFAFDETFTLTNGTPYVIAVEASGGDASNCVRGNRDATSPTHPGNACTYTTSWVAESTSDRIFRVYTTASNEATSTALAAQDTGYTADTSSGDVNLQVRVRLQSTNAAPPGATDDWQLQWEKNTSGTWAALQTSLTNLVPNPSLEVNTTGWAAQTNTTIARDGTNGGAIGSWALMATSTAAGIYAIQNSIGNVPVLPSTTYSISSYVFHTSVTNFVTSNVSFYTSGGIFISSSSDVTSVVRNAWTRVSDTVTTPSNAASIQFNATQTASAGGQKFWVDAFMATAGSTLQNYFDGSTAGASWSGTAHNSASTILVNSTTVVPYASANLTDGAATTNRLGSGSGSFVAGKLSEDGLVDDLGWTANNYTELLYSVTLKQADLAPTDTLRFRVLRNGATTGMTYTQVPTVTIGSAAPTDRTGVGTGSLSLAGTSLGVRDTTGVLTGSLTLTGSAAGSAAAAPVLGTASISLAVAGIAVGTHGVAGTATGAVAVAGVASGQVTVAATATATLTVTGTAVGQKTVTGTATGSLTVAGVMAGVRPMSGVATGALTISSAAVGAVAVTATAASSLTVSGAATGLHGVAGTASGSLALAGTGSGQVTVTAVATATLTISGTASGVKTVGGAATGQVVVSSLALGLVEGNAVGTATGQLTVGGLASGTKNVTALATGVVTLIALAVGRRDATGTATGHIDLDGTGSGSGASPGGVVTIIGEWNDVETTALQWGSLQVVDWYMLVPSAVTGTGTGTLTVTATATGLAGSVGVGTGAIAVSGATAGIVTPGAPSYGPPQTLIVVGKFGLNDPVANVTNRDGGVRVSFDTAGRVAQIRYRRLNTSAGTLTIRAWNDTTTAKVAEVTDTRSTSGQYTVTFPTPALVTTTGTWTFTVGAAGAVPISGIEAEATNTADVNYVATRSSTIFGNYPTVAEGTGNTFYVEPIFEPQL